MKSCVCVHTPLNCNVRLLKRDIFTNKSLQTLVVRIFIPVYARETRREINDAYIYIIYTHTHIVSTSNFV